MEKINYGGWESCYRLSNDMLELVVTADIGPRVIRLAVPGRSNLFKEFHEMMGRTGGDQWRIYGGHRLWHAPESSPRTYQPDNEPVGIERIEGGLRTLQDVEVATGIEKQMDICLHRNRPHVELTHRLVNHNLWAVTLSAWSLSVMAPGGEALVPLPPHQPHGERLSPSYPLVMWPYTSMGDDRWEWGERLIRLKQDESAKNPQKIGVALEDGRACYLLEDQLFIKKYSHRKGAVYPDLGSSFEVFTDAEMLEMESLSPLVSLQPGESLEHTEQWFVFEGVSLSNEEERMSEELDGLFHATNQALPSSAAS